jgi:hypothetical protein
VIGSGVKTKIALLARRLEEGSRWDKLRRWGASPLVRSSVAFAAAGYFLRFGFAFLCQLAILLCNYADSSRAIWTSTNPETPPSDSLWYFHYRTLVNVTFSVR